MKEVFKVSNMGQEELSFSPNYEEQVFLHSGNICKLRNGQSDEETWEMLVKIKVPNRKPIYRKAYSAHVDGDTIKLGYRSRNILGVQEGDTVSVKRTCWFPYCWRHYNSTIRGAFRVGIISLGLTCISLVVTCISSILSLICCLF